MTNDMRMHNNGSPGEPSQGIKAASGMREAALQAQKEAWRTVLIWAVLLVIASVAFAALTARPLARLTGDFAIAYVVSVFLHLALGLAAHLWKLGRARRLPMTSIYGAFTILLILGIFVVAILRAQLMLERTLGVEQQISLAQRLSPYLISLFMAILEVVIPMLFGVKLADSWLNYEARKRDFDYASIFARRITSENDPMEAWIHEAYSLKKERQELEQQIAQKRHEIAYLDAAGKTADADVAEAAMHTLEGQIRELNHRLSLIERWYPGNPRELHDTSDELLAPKTPATDNYTPQSPPLSLEANEPQQLPPPQTEPTSPQGDEPDKKEPKP